MPPEEPETMTDTHASGREASAHEVQHPGDIGGEAHGPDDHGEQDGHDDHAHVSAALGPVDVEAWGALLLGTALGLIMAICLGASAGGA
jgi:ABC-type nickel/cobalt efflux system permease component RcnA